MQHDRRRFLGKALAFTGAAALTACQNKASEDVKCPTLPEPEAKAPEPPAPVQAGLIDGLDEAHFIVHNPKPLALESLRHSIGLGALTSTNRLFVRNNLPHPDKKIVAEADQWTLKIEGVQNPRSFTLAELKQFAYENLCAVLQCSGNGRAFFKHGPSGSQWATGAAGCVSWGGARLTDVLEACGGPIASMKFLTATGGEELPEDVDREKAIVERSIPIEKGMGDCLLAWELNGEPIPLSHGGPLRLVVPGYFGCNQIKYVKQIAATADQSKAKIMQSGYRFRNIGEKGSEKQPSMWRMPVKSWLTSALPLGDNSFRLKGVAFSGERGIKSVEYSLDGDSWQKADFYGPDLGVHAWRCFQIELRDVAASVHTVYTRATDNAGDVQPKARIENERGYGNNSWLDHGFTIREGAQEEAVAVAAIEIDDETKAAGKKIFVEGPLPCGTCHTLADANTMAQVGPNLDLLKPDVARVERAVSNGVGAMPSFGDLLSKEEIKAVSEYVTFVTQK